MTDLEDDLHVLTYQYVAYPQDLVGELSLEDHYPKIISLYKFSRLCSPDMKQASQRNIWYVKAQEKPILEASTLSELKLKAIVAFGVDKIFKTENMASVVLGDSLTREDFAELKLA